MEKRRVTIKDIAEKVGVAPSTVSMVIHNNHSIPEVTKQKVLQAIEELHYYPNLAARSLVGGKTNTIALVASFFYPFFNREILNGIEHNLKARDYCIQQFSTRGDEAIKNEIYSKILYGNTADAVISFNECPNEKLLNRYKEENFPLVLLEQNIPGVHSVICNNFKGGYLAAEHFFQTGKKKTALVLGKAWHSRIPNERLEGFKKFLEEKAIPFNKKMMFEVPHINFVEGIAVFNKIMSSVQSPDEIDSIFSIAGDAVAIGIMEGAKNSGMRIPEKIAVIGFDDLEIANFVTPPLTTIRQFGIDIGNYAIDLAVDSIKSMNKNIKKIMIEPELIIRKSA